jgi:hypothetical protein
MWDPAVISSPRTSAETQAIVQAANQERQAKKKEALLQPLGLRGVEVILSRFYLFCTTLMRLRRIPECILEDQ